MYHHKNKRTLKDIRFGLILIIINALGYSHFQSLLHF